jgi:hypothetical protein
MPLASNSQIIGALVVTASFLAACSDRIDNNYRTLADAERDGAIDRGWLPSILPASTRNIRESHNIDTNEVWCSFELSNVSPEEESAFRAALTKMTHGERLRNLRVSGVAWWPRELEGELNPEALKSAGLEIFGDSKAVFAIDWSRKRGYFYSSGR